MHRNHPQVRRLPLIAESLSLSTQQSPLNTAPSLNAEAFGQTSRWSRPETHQNLIHPDKERRLHLETPPASQFHTEPSMPIAFASPRYHPIISTPQPMKPGSWW